MDKQQQIDKLAKTMESAKLKARGTLGSMNDGFGVWYATALINAGIGDLRELGERIKSEFHKQFDELIPSIMSDKIDSVIDEMCGVSKK